jgi:hypothetical protein
MVIIGIMHRPRFSGAQRRFEQFAQMYSVLNGAFEPGATVGANKPEQLPAQSLGGTYALSPSVPLSARDNGSSARIDIAQSRLYLGNRTITYNARTLTGLSFSRDYYVYALDPNLNGGSVSYQASTVRTGLPEGHVYFGFIRTPPNGGSSTGGSPGGFGGGGGISDPNVLFQ